MGVMTRFRSYLLALAAVASLALAVEPTAAARLKLNLNLGYGSTGADLGITLAQQAPRKGGGACLSEQQIAKAIASGQIRSWAAIRQAAGIPNDYYETSDVQVCVRNGAPFYIVNMVSPKGENVKYVLNALDGSG
jgi:hypothetical protein